MSAKERIACILPERLKARIRPYYLRLFGRPSTVAIDSFGAFEVAYRKGTADETVLSESFENDFYLPGVPEYQAEEDHVIIDIGAHIGTFSILAASKARRGKVFAIEASQESFNLLRINVLLNRCSNISVHHVALADREGTCTLYHDSGNWGHSIVKRLSRSNETVRSCTLADFMQRNRIGECDFIKFNCEGGEFPILLSTPASVLQRIKDMLVLYHGDLWDKNTERDLIAHLESSGFHCVVRNQTEKRGWIVAKNTERKLDHRTASPLATSIAS